MRGIDRFNRKSSESCAKPRPCGITHRGSSATNPRTPMRALQAISIKNRRPRHASRTRLGGEFQKKLNGKKNAERRHLRIFRCTARGSLAAGCAVRACRVRRARCIHNIVQQHHAVDANVHHEGMQRVVKPRYAEYIHVREVLV